jgi:drug/metabolite transporter (DMT)-like permease
MKQIEAAPRGVASYTKIIVRPVLVTTGILLIPLLGNIYVDGWDWPWTAFAFFGVILLVAGLAYELAGRHAKAGVAIGFACGQVVAVGVIAMLRYMNPDEDLAGIVIITFLLSGLLFAFIGYLIQKQLKRN